MARNISLNCLVATLCVAFVVSGCQSSNSKLVSAWKERTKPKTEFKSSEPDEVVTYWPYKADRTKQKIAMNSSQLKNKLARKTDQKKRDEQVADFIKEGDQFKKDKKLEDARLAYNQALKLAPENPDVHHRLAIIADKQIHYAEADEHYQAALKVRPRDPNLFSDLGYSYSMRGNNQKAEQTLKKALEIDPSHKLAMVNLGALYIRQNRLPEALSLFRAGTVTEAEAQQYVAMLSRQNGSPIVSGEMPGVGPGQTDPILAAAARSIPDDLTKLDFEQVKALMAREKQDAIQRRRQENQQQNRGLPYDEATDLQMRMATANQGYSGGNFPAADYPAGPQNGGSMPNGPQGNTSFANNQYANNQYEASGPQGQFGPNGQYNAAIQGNSMNNPHNPANQARLIAEAGRSPQGLNEVRTGSPQLQQGRPGNPPIQQAGGLRQLPAGSNNYQQYIEPGYANEMATQLGMNAGPGGMFPIVPVSENEGLTAGGPASSFNNRFGGEFQQTQAYQNAPNWGGNPNQPSSPASSNSVDGLPAIGPSTPSQNWGSPAAGGLNWQAGNANSLNWANGNAPGSGAAGSGLDSGVSLLRSDQDAVQNIGGAGNSQSAANSPARLRNVNPSQPYSGVWPNTNSLPTGQNQTNAANAPAAGGANANGFNPANSGVIVTPGNQSGTSNNSIPMYPYAPNR